MGAPEGTAGTTPLVTEERQPNGFMRWVRATVLLELPSHLRAAYGWFGLCLVLLIGSQGFIFPVRSSIFYGIMEAGGAHRDAMAKTLLPVVQLPCVIGFNALWGFTRSPKLMIGLICSIFTGLYLAVFISLVTGGFDRKDLWLGYVMYYSTELKAVICPVMIWCVLNDLTPPKLARIAYPPIVFFIQVGTIIGSFMAGEVDWFGGNTGLVIIQVVCLILAIFCGLRGVTVFKSEPMPEAYLDRPAADTENAAAPQEDEKKESCLRKAWSGFEGIWLILSHPYLLCTMWCSVAHLVPRLFLDFQGTQVVVNYCKVHNGVDAPHHVLSSCKTSFFGWVNFVQAILTMLVALVGTRKIIEYGGLRCSLSVLPMFALVTVLVTCLTLWSCGEKNVAPAKGADPDWLLPNLWITQISIILMNTFGYGLNGPSREMLYVKTVRDMKYKAKSWSDMYGNNGMKSAASAINLAFNSGHLSSWVTGGVTVGWVAVWMCIVQWVGLKHKSLMSTKMVIGHEEGPWPCLIFLFCPWPCLKPCFPEE